MRSIKCCWVTTCVSDFKSNNCKFYSSALFQNILWNLIWGVYLYFKFCVIKQQNKYGYVFLLISYRNKLVEHPYSEKYNFIENGILEYNFTLNIIMRNKIYFICKIILMLCMHVKLAIVTSLTTCSNKVE